jgi:hypothetical protein
MDGVLVTFATRVLGDAPAPFLDLDGFVKIVRRKGQRMKEAVLRLGEVFWDQPRRRMTVVARRNRAMARFDPAVEVILHDMAVGAGLGIVGEIDAPLA